MKIMRYYWSAERQKHLCDRVLSVIRGTKIQLIAIYRRHPRVEYRFRKPKQFGNGVCIKQVGDHDRFSLYHYEMELE